LGKNVLHPQKYALPYIYAQNLAQHKRNLVKRERRVRTESNFHLCPGFYGKFLGCFYLTFQAIHDVICLCYTRAYSRSFTVLQFVLCCSKRVRCALLLSHKMKLKSVRSHYAKAKICCFQT